MSVTKPRFTLEFEKPIRELEDKIAALRASSESAGMDVTKEAVSMEAKLAQTRREVYGNLTPGSASSWHDTPAGPTPWTISG